MFEQTVRALVALLGLYLGIGVVFAAAFVAVGVQRVDEGAKGSGWGFRALIFPGTVAFWPLLFSRWLREVSELPQEESARR